VRIARGRDGVFVEASGGRIWIWRRFMRIEEDDGELGSSESHCERDLFVLDDESSQMKLSRDKLRTAGHKAATIPTQQCPRASNTLCTSHLLKSEATTQRQSMIMMKMTTITKTLQHDERC
jgi:hypothetical protein